MLGPEEACVVAAGVIRSKRLFPAVAVVAGAELLEDAVAPKGPKGLLVLMLVFVLREPKRFGFWLFVVGLPVEVPNGLGVFCELVPGAPKREVMMKGIRGKRRRSKESSGIGERVVLNLRPVVIWTEGLSWANDTQ